MVNAADRRLQRELRYFCIMGAQKRQGGQTAIVVEPEILLTRGLVDSTGAITPKGHDFMRA